MATGRGLLVGHHHLLVLPGGQRRVVLADLAVAIADGAKSFSDLARPDLFGPGERHPPPGKGSTPGERP